MEKELLNRIQEECFIRNLTVQTSKMYEFYIEKFLKWTDYKPVDELSLSDARKFILELRESGKTSWYCNAINSSLSFFYKRVLHKQWSIDIVPRMKIEWKLPEVLTRNEIEKLVDTAQTTRNKAIIALLYSSGLRVGELVRLAPEDINMSTMQIHVRDTKNRGDHWTILSERALELLIQYWYEYPVKREILFVTSRNPHNPLKSGGVEIMLKKIGKEIGLDIHPHTLRHSFATHLIENGVSREHVQTLLGHRSPTSTSVYINLTNKSIMGISSPFDLPLDNENDNPEES